MNLLPKQAGNRYPTSRYSVFGVEPVSGQIRKRLNLRSNFFAEGEGGGKERKRGKTEGDGLKYENMKKSGQKQAKYVEMGKWGTVKAGKRRKKHAGAAEKTENRHFWPFPVEGD